MNFNIPGMSNLLNQKFSQLQLSAYDKDIGHTSRPNMQGHGDMDILPVPSVGSRVSVYVCEALGVWWTKQITATWSIPEVLATGGFDRWFLNWRFTLLIRERWV